MGNVSTTSDVLNVDPAEYTLEELHDIIAGRSQRLPAVIALSVLRRKKYPIEEKTADLQRIMLDEQATPRLRTAAAVELGRLGAEPAQNTLLGLSGSADPVLNRAANLGLREMSRSGDPAAVGREQPAILEAMTGSVSPTLEVDPQKAGSITHRKAPADTAGQIVTDLAVEAPDVALDAGTARFLRCNDRTLAFVATQAITGLLNEPETLTMPLVTGLVAAKDTVDDDEWIARYYLLAGPGKQAGEITLQLLSTSGRPVMSGEAAVADGKADFNLRSVTGPGNFPAELSGRYYSSGRLRMTEARSEPRVTEKLVPTIRTNRGPAS